MEDNKKALEYKQELMDEIEFYCKEIGIKYPDGYPDNMTLEEMRDFVEVWSEYDPCPELD